MVTRLYLHAALSTISGTLPAASQSTAHTATGNYESQATNRSMDTTIGTAQTNLDFVRAATSSADPKFYITTFISQALNQTSIAANTWQWNFACKNTSTTNCKDYPSNNTDDKIPICCYVWRPSTGAKVGNILDGVTANAYYDTGNGSLQTPSTAECAEDGTFAGSAVTCQVGDVIVVEAWTYINTSNSTSTTYSFYFDGTTVTTTDGPTVSNHASFLQTPENLSFSTPPPSSINMTQVSAQLYSNLLLLP